MAGQARVLRVITGCGSPAIIAALACPAPAGPIDAGGVLEADQVLAVLLAGALEAGNPEAKARATIKSGLAAGSDAGNGRARYWSPTTPTWMPQRRRRRTGRWWGRGRGMTCLAASWIQASPKAAHGSSQVASSLTSERHQGRNVLTSAAHHHENQAAALRCWRSGRRDRCVPWCSRWRRGRVAVGAARGELLAAERPGTGHGEGSPVPELVIDFITSLDGYGPPRAGPAGGVWKGPSTSPGWQATRRRTPPS
jgi:hypothetical protein